MVTAPITVAAGCTNAVAATVGCWSSNAYSAMLVRVPVLLAHRHAVQHVALHLVGLEARQLLLALAQHHHAERRVLRAPRADVLAVGELQLVPIGHIYGDQPTSRWRAPSPSAQQHSVL